MALNVSGRTSLLIGLSIPVIMVVVVASLVFLPPLLTDEPDPKQSFLYRWGAHDPYHEYLVVDRRLNINVLREPTGNAQKPTQRFFIYDPTDASNTAVSAERAQSLLLDPAERSAEGYVVSRGRSNSGLLFGFRNSQRSISLQGSTRKVDIRLPDNVESHYNRSRFRFIGWIATNE